MIHNNKLFLALVMSALVHGMLLFHYAADETVVDASETQSATVSVELISHVAQTPAKKIKKQPVQVRQEIVADAVAESITPDEALSAGAEELPAPVISASSGKQEQFVSLLHQAINQHKRYPYQAKRQQREGLVKLQFVVHPDGQVTDVSVVESSHFDVLDAAAREAVNAISPFQLAENYINEQKIYDVDIAFRLN